MPLFREPRFVNDPQYQAEVAWQISYHPELCKNGPLALEYAKLKHAEVTAAQDRLDDKLADLQRTAAGLAAVTTAAVGAFNLPAVMPAVSLSFFLVAMMVALLARRALLRPGMPAIRGVLNGFEDPSLEHEHTPHAWLAACLHGSAAGFKPLEDWAASRLLLGSWLVIAGVGCFLPMIVLIARR